MHPSQRSDCDAPSALGCCGPQIRIIFSYGVAPQPQWHILQLFQGPIHATLELKFRGFPLIDLVTLLNSLWCWQRAAYELAACLRHTSFSQIQTSFSGAETPRESWEAPIRLRHFPFTVILILQNSLDSARGHVFLFFLGVIISISERAYM